MSVGRVVQAVRSDSFAGVERYICDVSAELMRRGWQVTVVGGDPVQMARRLPPATHHLPASTAAQVGLALLRLGRGAVVHVHMTAAELPAVALKPLSRTRVVATRHFARTRGSSAAARSLSRFIARGIDQQVSISEFVAEAVAEPSIVVYNGVPCARTTATGTREPFVAVVQRHEAEKQTDIAIRAWSLTTARRHGWRLLIAGRGSLTGQLRSLAEELGVTDTVEFAGFLPDTQQVMSRAGIFLATAPAEPFGLAAVEAMAHAVPVVAAAGGAHLETLREVSLMFPPGDAAGCAAAIDQLAEDASLRSSLGQAAVKRQRAHFSIQGHTDAIEAIYRRLMA